ncbi:MAG TPA: cupin domain-containing protein [Solirubrobacterales bacterium]|nr:cupin domain-containing protein [Solirubrobacterales bacterium]
MPDGVAYAQLRRGADMFQSLRRELGVESFGINLMSLRPGQRLRIHRHRRQEEVYLVLEGTLTLLIEGEPHDLGPDHLARVGPEVRRQLTNRTPEPVVLLALGGSGEHEGRDGLAWVDWDEEGPGREPREIPLPDDLPI